MQSQPLGRGSSPTAWRGRRREGFLRLKSTKTEKICRSAIIRRIRGIDTTMAFMHTGDGDGDGDGGGAEGGRGRERGKIEARTWIKKRVKVATKNPPGGTQARAGMWQKRHVIPQ